MSKVHSGSHIAHCDDIVALYWARRVAAVFNPKQRLTLARDAAVAATFPDAGALAALRRSSDARWGAMVQAQRAGGPHGSTDLRA